MKERVRRLSTGENSDYGALQKAVTLVLLSSLSSGRGAVGQGLPLAPSAVLFVGSASGASAQHARIYAFRIRIVDRACTIRVSTFLSSNHPVHQIPPQAKRQSELQNPRSSASAEYSARARDAGSSGIFPGGTGSWIMELTLSLGLGGI